MTDWNSIPAATPAGTSLRASADVAERLGQHIRAGHYRDMARDADAAGALYDTFAREAAAWAAGQEQAA